MSASGAVLEVDVWSDFLCPWCYVASSRVEWLAADERVSLRRLPYELHPNVPIGGRSTARVYGHGDPERAERALAGFATLSAAEGLGWQMPDTVPNTRLALAVDEWLRRHEPDVHPSFHTTVFDELWAAGGEIGTSDALAALVERSGGNGAEAIDGARIAIAEGWLEASHAGAVEKGVTGTPAFVFGELVVPGLQDQAFFERIVSRLISRAH